MSKGLFVHWQVLALCTVSACGSSTSMPSGAGDFAATDTPQAGTATQAPTASSTSASSTTRTTAAVPTTNSGAAGSQTAGGLAGVAGRAPAGMTTAGMTASTTAGTTASVANAGNGSSAGMGVPAGSGGAPGATASAGTTGSAGAPASMASGGQSQLTGMLGALGPVQPVMAGWATTNGLETLIYLSSAPLTCAMMMTRGVKWLSSLPAGSQVIEIVVRGTAMVGTTPVGVLQGEVNYAEGSKSSSTEVNATGGSIMFTKAEDKKVYEGMVMASYPMGSVMGTFHADWCEGGTEY